MKAAECVRKSKNGQVREWHTHTQNEEGEKKSAKKICVYRLVSEVLQ